MHSFVGRHRLVDRLANLMQTSRTVIKTYGAIHRPFCDDRGFVSNTRGDVLNSTLFAALNQAAIGGNLGDQ